MSIDFTGTVRAYLFFAEFAVEMRYPSVDEIVELIDAVLRNAEPVLRSHLLLAVGHEGRRSRYRLVDRFPHAESQVQRWVIARTRRSRYQFFGNKHKLISRIKKGVNIVLTVERDEQFGHVVDGNHGSVVEFGLLRR